MISTSWVNRVHTRFKSILHSLGRLEETNQRISLLCWYIHPIDRKRLRNQRKDGQLSHYKTLRVEGKQNQESYLEHTGVSTGGERLDFSKWCYGLSGKGPP